MGGVWYVEFPLNQYAEDAKALAVERGLTIVDKAFQGSNLQMRDAPILTLKEKITVKK